MKVTVFKTHKIMPGEILEKIIMSTIPRIENDSILVITSKIMSICQNRLIKKDKIAHKMDLIKQEADYYLEGDYSKKYGICLTIKNGLLIPTAGIDESNSNGHYILYPNNIQKEAALLWQNLKEKYQIKNLGILITDSHTTPLRRGVTGIALGWCGFKALYNYIGKPDIDGNALRVTQVNVLDGLAAAAVLEMGEGDEQTPLAIIQGSRKVAFQDAPPTKDELDLVHISIEEDLYAPLIAKGDWKSSI